MKTLRRIRFRDTKSPCVRCYGISVKTGRTNVTFSQSEPIDLPTDAADEKNYNATVATCHVVNRLIAIPGITHLRFRPYEVNVTLASVFDWEDVHESIIQILKEEYFPNQDVDVQKAFATASAED